jgi:hypothetical protein
MSSANSRNLNSIALKGDHMKRNLIVALAAAAAMVFLAALADAQTETKNSTVITDTKAVNSQAMTPEAKIAASPLVPKIELQNYRPEDQRGLNVFENPKTEGAQYEGFKLFWGAAFTQQFQGLDHKNTASPKITAGVDANKLIRIGHGFNNAVANLYLNAQLAPGIRVSTTMYSSARHHNEAWMKDGYLAIDASPIDFQPLNTLMKYVTIKAGHFETSYGDAHFRRTDNGNAMRNPLVGNYIMDAFTTEVGGEVMVRADNYLGLLSVTGGESRGQVTSPEKRAPSFISKLGFDRQFNRDLRIRLTGSMYATAKSVNNTLYSGDRAGSRYYDVLENTASTESAQAWSGAIQPGMSNSLHAFVINPFVKYDGLEFFGNFERARGRAAGETANRDMKQYVGELTYRFLDANKLFVVGRYNRVAGQLKGMTNDISVNRYQVGGGWFMTPNVVTKLEFVNQKYNDFPTTDIRNGGQFRGFMVEGSVAF